jgi:hypothetical protein
VLHELNRILDSGLWRRGGFGLISCCPRNLAFLERPAGQIDSDAARAGVPALHKQSSGWRKPSEKDLAVVKRGVARSEIWRCLAPEIEGLVALETWQSDSEIANLT